MSNNNSIMYGTFEAVDVVGNLYSEAFSIPSIKKKVEQQSFALEQEVFYNPLQNDSAWRIVQENDELAADPISFVNDIMKIMNENPKLYDALAKDQYES